MFRTTTIGRLHAAAASPLLDVDQTADSVIAKNSAAHHREGTPPERTLTLSDAVVERIEQLYPPVERADLPPETTD